LSSRITFEKHWIEVVLELTEACSSSAVVNLEESTEGGVYELLVGKQAITVGVPFGLVTV
jgi:hypothetical protein